jgi:hypothetical protein
MQCRTQGLWLGWPCCRHLWTLLLLLLLLLLPGLHCRGLHKEILQLGLLLIAAILLLLLLLLLSRHPCLPAAQVLGCCCCCRIVCDAAGC